jgi:prepilin-type processing-associated H-X9-DG protein
MGALWSTQHECRPTPTRAEQAFNRAELMVVVAVLAVFACLQFAVLGNSNGTSRLTVCLANLHRMAAAWQMYTQDNRGLLVGNLDGGDVQALSNSNRTWVLGWFEFSGGTPFPAAAGGSADTNSLLLTQFSPLATYLDHDARVFKCPADTSLSRGTRGLPRVRSISMNSYIGDRNGPFTSGYHQFRTINEFTKLPPASAFVFIDEREDSINDATLLIDMTGANPVNPMAYTIVDFPADYHDRGANLSFADGHAETWRWHDPRTTPPHRPGTLISLGVASPNNPDVARIHAAASFRGP